MFKQHHATEEKALRRLLVKEVGRRQAIKLIKEKKREAKEYHDQNSIPQTN